MSTRDGDSSYSERTVGGGAGWLAGPFLYILTILGIFGLIGHCGNKSREREAIKWENKRIERMLEGKPVGPPKLGPYDSDYLKAFSQSNSSKNVTIIGKPIDVRCSTNKYLSLIHI